GDDGDEGNRKQCRQYDAPAEPIELTQGRRIGAEPEPGAVAERDEGGIADQDIETHARDREHHDVDRGAQRQAGEIQRIRKDGQPGSGDDERKNIFSHWRYSNFSMRSPSSPRGRNSNTSAIKRYIEASPKDGLK